MNIKQAFSLAMKSLAASKMRSFLTMLGIIIGVAAVIVIVSMVNGMTQDVLNEFENLGATTITVTVRGRGGNRSVSIDDMQNLVDDNPEYLESMTPNIMVPGMTAKNGSTNVDVSSCVGVNENYVPIKGLTIEQGRGIEYMDCEARLRNCVIGSYVAQELYGYTEAVGQEIKLNGQSYQVVGVLEEKADSAEGSADDIVIVPYTMASRLSKSFTMGSYTFNAAGKEVADKAQELIDGYLLGVFSNTNAYSVSNMASMIDTINELTDTLSLVLAGVAGVSLLVGGIGIMNIMLVSVTERTREIGIRKSLGATPWDIMSQFVVEAITTSCLGGVMGILLGIAGSYAVTLLDMTIALSVPAMLISFTISAAIGIAFGYFPAKKAAKLNPIEALRYD
ncbi:MAG: FtsX-like permease family protein [Ruminococcaceae bacterium]|nr:FtsX-like permease family protein [Oscillospiraceae bacterium]